MRARLGEAQLRKGSTRRSAAYVRNNAQLERTNPREIDAMVLRLARCALGAEVPLLAHDLPVRLPAIRRPAQNVLLGALSDGLDKLQPDPPQSLWLREEKADRLFSGPCGTPPAQDSTNRRRAVRGLVDP
jgi:hypothetical protein